MVQPWGVNVTLKRWDAGTQRRAVERLAELGAGWARLELDWYQDAPPATFDPFVDAARARGIEVLGLLTGLVPGTLGNLAGSAAFRHPLDELEGYLAFCARQAEHFRGRVAVWELWNEQNTARFWLRRPSAREYAAVLRPTAAELRRVDPGARLMMGSICGNDIDWLAPGIPRGYLRELADLGALDDVDLLGFHPYTLDCYASWRSLEETLAGIARRIDRFLEAYGELEKPAWITEIGVARTWVRLSQAQIGRLYAGLIAGSPAPVMLWCLSDFDDAVYVPGNPETAFGLAGVDLELNATGRTLRQLVARHMRDKGAAGLS